MACKSEIGILQILVETRETRATSALALQQENWTFAIEEKPSRVSGVESRILPGPVLAETAIGIRLRQGHHTTKVRSIGHASRHEPETNAHNGTFVLER